ncbi:response regulator receiver protein [Oceanithermus profundus DSM 14977]|uniref:Response regulator receiver protein n=1 Tax=Oceanithermus profundus (strain DSM 14977 / NBRC 100410 / VKM B-2274 / 506) TaxID=670487 RepID=E4U5P5_OCEP5|nr:response regulator transcription factor [Oceanithermus profundus]ADR35603.1 response regulator receiver protein [Oceanithermus profundus DSM 14977]
MKVLLIEDEPDMVALLEATLTPAGFEVHAERSGDAIEALLERHDPQVVIVDVMLFGSRADGFEVVRRIRRVAGHEETLVVVLTALEGEEYARRAREAGADLYLSKPFSPLELLERLQSAELLTD